ncbi:hypothetical protein EYZ11_007497 [Aspergillus tanneri]|nr:hypothetical protein EYZ11_007497 [Aspergillus tanneri]
MQEDETPVDFAPTGSRHPTLEGFPQEDLSKDGCVGFGDAVSYINKIKVSIYPGFLALYMHALMFNKDHFADTPDIYKEFFLILLAYKHGSLPPRDLYEQDAEPFATESDLVDDFKKFLPEATPYDS